MSSGSSYYIWPGQVHLGFGTASLAGHEAQAYEAACVFVVADPGVAAAGLLDPVTESLQAAGLSFVVWSEVVPNPESSSVDAAALAYHESQADMIIGVGGGSALDTAKALRIAVAGPPDVSVASYAYRLGPAGRAIPRHLPPCIAVPTTAGTGAEVTPWALLTDAAEKFKFGVGNGRTTPSVALIDPELMLTLPPFLTAATGIDALSHLVEAYVSTNRHQLLDALILHGLKLISRSLPLAYSEPTNRAARHDMAEAAMIGGIAISSNWLGACHSLAHQLSGFAGVQHGLANALMLPHQMTFSLPAAAQRYAQIAEALGMPAQGSLAEQAERAVAAVRLLTCELGLPQRLRDVGVDESLIPQMARYAYSADLCWTTNPRPVDQQQLAAIYREAF